jgi:hypothetical protein
MVDMAAQGWAAAAGIRIVGAILGILILVAAIRGLFGKRNGK